MRVRRPARPRSEHELIPAVRAHLEAHGFRVWANLDGADYFDLAAKRGSEVGLVELKLSDTSRVLLQALRRRAWADWVAVALASPRTARRLAGAGRSRPRSRVGVWLVEGGRVEVLRPASSLAAGGDLDPHRAARERFRRWLEAMETGEIPPFLRWSGVASETRRASQGRGFREWTLEELVEPP